MTNTRILQATRKKLQDKARSIPDNKVFVGLDGYIDLIQRAVKVQKQQGPEYFQTIEEFAIHTGKAAGKSAQIELITQETKLGGNAPIMAHAMGSLGFETTCIGNFGKEAIHPVFLDIHERVEMLSIGDSAMTNALEFQDGKLILSEVGPFKNLDWTYVKSVTGLDKLKEKIDGAALIALVDWCNLPYSTDIWRGFLEDVLPGLSARPRHFFFDIADPSRRTDKEIKEALEVIANYNSYGKVTLGLNENETEKLFDCLNRLNDTYADDSLPLNEKGRYIFDNIEVWNLLIHPTDRCISICGDKLIELRGKVVTAPRISTGGGDNFNAGYCLGQLIGLDLESSMILAMANSGSYVKNGKSSSITELDNYIREWIREVG